MPGGFLEYMMAQRGQRQKLGIDQPMSPPPQVDMVGLPPSGSSPSPSGGAPPSAGGGPGFPPPGPPPAGPEPPPSLTPDVLTASALPPGTTRGGVDAAAMTDLADDAWETNFYRLNSRWPTSLEYQMAATAREMSAQTGRAPSRSELLATVFQRVLMPPPETPEFEEL